MNEVEMKDLALRLIRATEKIALELGEVERLIALHSELTLKLMEHMSESLAYIANASEEK